MATLTEIAKTSRDLVKFGLFLGAVLIFIYSGYKIYTSRPKPAPPIIPTVDFGKLPSISFPEEKQRPSELILQTIQGSPPEATSVARVYPVEKKSPGLLAGRFAQQFAKQLNFPPEPENKSTEEYIFSDPEYPARRLSYKIASGNFNLKFDLSLDKSPINGNSLPAKKDNAIEEAVKLLQSLNKYPSYISEGTPIATYLDWENGEFVPVKESLNASFVRIDFMPQNVGDFKIKTPTPEKSSVYIILSGKRNQKERIVAINYSIYPPDLSVFATYPLKSSSQAWEELKKGEGYIAVIGRGNESQAYVRDAYLAYFDPGTPHEFLQPIFVFTGDRGFEAYVPAVAKEWIR